MKKIVFLWIFLVISSLKGVAAQQAICLYEVRNNCGIVQGGKNKPSKSVANRNHLYIINNDGYLMVKSSFGICNNVQILLLSPLGDILYSDAFVCCDTWVYIPNDILSESATIQVVSQGTLFQGSI